MNESAGREVKRRKVEGRISAPEDLVIVYDASVEHPESKLFARLRQLVNTDHAFSRHFKTARKLLNQLGPCASDLVRVLIYSASKHKSDGLIVLRCGEKSSKVHLC